MVATSNDVLQLGYSQYIIYGCSTLAVVWGAVKANQVSARAEACCLRSADFSQNFRSKMSKSTKPSLSPSMERLETTKPTNRPLTTSCRPLTPLSKR